MSSESPTPPLVLGFVSVRHSCRAIARTALAYSNIRRIRWPLAYLDLPLLFVVFGLVHTAKLDTFVSLGKTSGHLDRNGQEGTVTPPKRARRSLLLIISAEVIVVFSVIPTVIESRWPGTDITRPFGLYFVVFAGLPVVGYALSAFYQSYRASKTDEWEADSSRAYGGRDPVKANTLASWPIKGGGRRKSTGHGLELVRALAADARSRGQIKVGVARDLELAVIYVSKTGAELSTTNPKHVR